MRFFRGDTDVLAVTAMPGRAQRENPALCACTAHARPVGGLLPVANPSAGRAR
jgi:hypothetical protein